MVCLSEGMTLAIQLKPMKKILVTATTVSALGAMAFTPAPAHAFGGLINAALGTTVNVIQENERRNAETRRLEIEAQERATEEAIQAEVERRLAQERAKSGREGGTQQSSAAASSASNEMAAFRAEMAAVGIDACDPNFVGSSLAVPFLPGATEMFAAEMGCTKSDAAAWDAKARQRDEACMANGYKGFNHVEGKCWL